jgi:hypothetical protein
MRKTWVVLTIVILAVTCAAGRADDAKKDPSQPPKSPYGVVTVPAIEAPVQSAAASPPASSENAAPATEAIVPTGAKEEEKDDGKDYVIPIDAKDAAHPPALPAGAPKSGIVCPASPNCHCGRGRECCQHIWWWLTYRPLSKPGLAGCCQKCGGCHVPPLYTYFLDHCHAAGCETGGGPGCQTCAHHP